MPQLRPGSKANKVQINLSISRGNLTLPAVRVKPSGVEQIGDAWKDSYAFAVYLGFNNFAGRKKKGKQGDL